MAIDASPTEIATYLIVAGDCNIHLNCPPLFGDLIMVTLTGWQVRSVEKTHDADIVITRCEDEFRLVCARVDLDCRYWDLVDVLNVLFIAIARLYALGQPQKTMLHCAAFTAQDAMATLVVGGRKMGKSVLTWQAACQGATVLADDLLLWDQNAAEFECLGLPIRLRRPVPWDRHADELKKGIIAGHKLAYTVRSFMPIAPVGHIFCPDEILAAQSVGVFTPVPVAQIWQTLLACRIA